MLTTEMMRAVHADRIREIEERLRVRRLLEAGGEDPAGRWTNSAIRARRTSPRRGIGFDPA
jgi:hypothetical protein